MPSIPAPVDTRGYKLVGEIPRSNDFANAIQGMVKRGAAKDKAYEDKNDLRQAGILAQLSRIQDPDQYNSYLQNAIANAQDDEERGELEHLSTFDQPTGQQITQGILRGSPHAGMLATESSAQRKSWKLNTRPIPTGEKNDKGEPLYNLSAGSITQNPDGSIKKSTINIIENATIAEINADSRSKGYESEQGKIQARQDAADQDAQDAAKKAGMVAEAQSDDELKNIYNITLEKAKAQAAQSTLTANTEAVNNLDQLKPLFAMADDALANDAGFYAGNIMDDLQSKGLPYLGFVLNEPKLNNTAQLRMALTNLKIGAKPAGSGNPTEGEWKMYAQTIPDPELSTPGQLVTAYRKYKKLVDDKYAEIARSQGRLSAPKPEEITPVKSKFIIKKVEP